MQQFPASQNFPSAAQAQSIAAAQAQYLNPTPAQYAVPAQAPYAADASHLNSPQPLNIATLPASSAIGAPSLRPAIASAPQGVKFELKQIKPTLRDVQLKVSLRNDTDAPLNLSDKVQAVIKYNNLTEAEMKVAFDSPVIAPHSTVDGVVKVPFNKVDPTADLVLRNMPAPCGDELHIVKTAISQK